MVERSTVAGGVADIAWLSSVPALTGADHVLGFAGASVGGQPLTAALALTAPKGDASVELATGTSALTTVAVPAGTTKVVSVPAEQATYVRAVSGAGPVVASRLLTATTAEGDLVTASSLWPLAVVQHLRAITPAS
jgi:hypothetical protein